MPLSIHSFPRAILHIDGDSFFASCEAAIHPELRGRPVVTGAERGIASSMSYDLKALGVHRGMSLAQIKKICPSVIVLPSDYETYSLFSKRMYEIVRRYTPDIEEYSIDECFADLTGLRRVNKMSYEDMAVCIKHDLDSELGITFSLGLGPNKVVAKIGSKWKKPSGLTIIPAKNLDTYLRELPVEKIWGIGPQTTAYLNKLGVFTAFDFAKKDESWLEGKMSKPFKEIWRELRGEYVFPLTLGEKHDYQSISKTKTFTPPSQNESFVFSELAKNIENACIKARRHKLSAKKIFFFLKTQEFRYQGLEITLTSRSAEPHEIISLVRDQFHKVWRPHTLYRATGIVLMQLCGEEHTQLDLFGSILKLESWKPVYAAVDALDSKFGKHTVYLGSTQHALTTAMHRGPRGITPTRGNLLFKGETRRQHINIPSLGEVS